MSMPLKSKVARSRTLSFVVSPNDNLLADRARRGQRHELVDRELALGVDIQELATDIAGGADDGDLVTHDLRLRLGAGV